MASAWANPTNPINKTNTVRKFVNFIFCSRIYKSRYSFSHFFELEDRILENVLEFFREYLSNRKYARELLKNNQHELKNFVRLYYQGIASISREQAQSPTTSRLLEIFLEVNTVNSAIQDLLQKILIGTNL